MNNKKFLDLGLKSLAGELTGDEEKYFNDLIALSDQNQKEFERLKLFWNRSQINSEVAIDLEEDWELLDQRILDSEVNRKTKTVPGLIQKIYDFLLIPKLRPAIYVASVALVLIFSFLLFTKEGVRTEKLTAQTYSKDIKTISLSDGSSVILNKDSKLFYPNVFNENSREVSLEGEAFFSIKKDGRPFIIKTSNAKTTVVGTKFNVWARDQKTRVSVNEGKVRVCDVINKQPVYLTRNEQSTVLQNNKPSDPKIVDSDFLTEWIKEKLVFSNSPLNEVVSELRSYYSVNIAVDGANLSNYNLTGSFKNHDVDSVLAMICLALDVNYSKNETGYVIKLRN